MRGLRRQTISAQILVIVPKFATQPKYAFCIACRTRIFVFPIHQVVLVLRIVLSSRSLTMSRRPGGTVDSSLFLAKNFSADVGPEFLENVI